MTQSRLSMFACAALCVTAFTAVPDALAQSESYLTWSAKQAEVIGASAYRRGRVGRLLDTRLLKTERAYNYKLAATLLTPDTIRATARMLQLRSRLSDDQARALVAEAEAVSGVTVIIEIDPREGSGVIPSDWEAFLQPRDDPSRGVRGTINSGLRDVKALAGVLRRNYDYDRFWVTFDIPKDGTVFRTTDAAAELVVRIHEREGRIDWPIPASWRPATQSP